MAVSIGAPRQLLRRLREVMAQRESAQARLDNVDVVHARAESWPEGVGRNDVVTARALAALPVLCEYAAPLLRDGGTLVAWKGVVDATEAADGAAGAASVGAATASSGASASSHTAV